MNPKRLLTVSIFLFFLLSGLTYAQDTLQKRFNPPPEFTRVKVSPNSLAAWLRKLPLLEPGSAVLDFRGKIFKPGNDSSVAAVVDMNVKGRRLEQCMDILLRLYSDYLIANGKRDSLKFPLPDGLPLSWKQWRAGFRPLFKGLHFQLRKSGSADSSTKSFHNYLNTIFSYTGSQTFFHYYPDISPDKLQIGDFIVRKVRKGHAVLIIDMVENVRAQKMVLVGQGDTPACPFYILRNKNGSPWFSLDSTKKYLDLPIRKKMYWRGLRRFPAYSD